MKQRCLFISLLALIVSVFQLIPVQAQNQFAIYNYRNDGDFNAWLDIDVEKITYSCTDLDGVEHDDIVVQEVWTPDSVYRIPISAIDSIGFRAPKIEYQDNVFHITEAHLPYIISVDDNSITFSNSLPENMRPHVGQVITSDTFESPLSDGFAGKVTSTNNVSGTFHVVCEAVQVTDVFKKLVIVGKAYAVNEASAKHGQRFAPKKLKDYLDTDKVEFEFPGKVSVKIGDFISISDEVSMSADYYVYVDLPRFKLRATVTGNHDLKTDWTIDSDKILEWLGHDKEKSEPEWATPVWPIVSIPGVFNFGVRAGAFLAPSVKLSLTGSTPLTFSHTFGVEFSNTDTWSWIPTVTPIMSAHSELGTPEITLSLEGKLFAGIALGVKTVLIGDKVLSGDITGRFGPEFDAKMQMQQKLGDDDQFDWYSLLKDSKMGVQLKADAKVKAKVFGENLTVKLSWEWKWPIPQWSDFRYLFPDFTKPELRHWSMANPLSMYTTPSRDLIMPVQVGIGLFDASGVKQADYYNDGWYLLDVNWHDKDTRIDIGNLTPGETYTCRPLLNFMGLGEIKADPRTSFTVPEPVSLETTTITVQNDKAQNVAINGGWGNYSVAVQDKSVCTAELKQEGDSYYIQIVGKKDGGSTSVTLKDLRSQKTAAVLVSVTNEVVQRLIKVEPKEIDFGVVPVGTSKTEHFTVSNVGTSSLTFRLSEHHSDIDIPESGKEFTLAAGESKTFDVIYTPTNPNGGSGSAVRVFSDAENGTQYVTIEGQGAPSGDIAGTETITVNGVSFTMVSVDGGTFWMGSPDDDGDASSWERPLHEVTLSSFAIGQTEVTQELWEAVMGSNPSHFKGSSLPVEGVSCNDCQEFLTKLNALTGRSFRLPTEAEWEYAARGGSLSRGYKYAGSDDIEAVAWYRDNSGNTTHTVGTKAPNELGLYDMSGNVRECCQDWLGYYANLPSTNPCNKSVGSYRMNRGGGYISFAKYCRVAIRRDFSSSYWRDFPDYYYMDHGLRLAH